MIDRFKEVLNTYDGTKLIIAFADIKFSFPEEVLHPCLSVRDEKYGLIQPLNGRSVATLPEIEIALRQGATVEYIEAFVVEAGDGYIFRAALQDLIDKRDEAKRDGDKLKDGLYKLIVNTLYGKVAQGINPKSGFDLRREGGGTDGFSPVSQAYFSSMITGVLRAALSAILVATDELNAEGHNYLVISATTDGALIKVSDKSGVRFSDCLKDEYQSDVKSALQSGTNIFKSFEESDPILYEKLLEFPVIRLLQSSRSAWSYNDFIEIKHAVNHVLNIKTRGQIGAYDDTK